MKMKKPTLATLKSFIRKNEANLFIRVKSKFDGMTDGTEFINGAKFTPVSEHKTEWAESHKEHTLGFQGLWLVSQSRDYITAINEDGFVGFHVYNCCGSCDIGIKA